MKRRSQPNLRFVAKFYAYALDTTKSNPSVLPTGELEQVFSLHSKGICAKEKPYKPVEIKEGDRTINEQVELLIFKWDGSLARIKHDMFCYISQLDQIFQVLGNAFDPYGDKRWIHIYVVENVSQDIREKIPGALQQ